MVRFRLSLSCFFFLERNSKTWAGWWQCYRGESVLTVGPVWPSEVFSGAWPLEGREEN